MRASPSRALLALILVAGLTGAVSPVLAAEAAASAASQPANAVSAAFAGPFNAAQDLLKAGNGLGAMAKLKEIEALPNLTPYEQYLLLRVKAPAEYATNDTTGAARDFETLLANEHLPAADRLPLLKAHASVLYSSEQYSKAAVAIQRYLDAGGDDAQLRELLPQTQYVGKDYVAAAKGFRAQVDATYAAGRTPSEKTLRLLASAYSQAGDDAGYVVALEHLAVGYPKPEYWKELIGRASQGGKFSDRQFIDNMRLKSTVLGEVADSERLSYAAYVARAGYPGEAKRVLDDAYAKKPFTGNDLVEANKLRVDVNKAAASDRAQLAANESAARSAKDGNALVAQGLTEAVDGHPQQGVALMEQGIAKGGLKAPDEARLHLGYAQVLAGNYADALKSFQAVGASSSAGAQAHVWALYAQSKLQPTAPPADTATSK